MFQNYRLLPGTGWTQQVLAGVLVLCFLITGCTSNKPEDESETTGVEPAEVTLQVLVVDSPAIAGVAGRRWTAEGMGTAEFTEVTLEELASQEFKLAAEVDIVIYPSEMMVDLISQAQLMSIPKKYLDSDVVNRDEMLPHQRKFLQRYGREVWSLPLGDTYLTLVYDKKIFAENNLEVPETWEAYTEVAKKLRELGHRVEEPMADGWAGRLLLSRAAAYVRSRGKVSTVFEMENMTPLISEQPFPQCLEELRAALGDQMEPALTPAAIFNNLLERKTAMGITWPSKHFENSEGTVNEDLGIARLPGSNQWYNRLESRWEPRDKDASIHMELMGSSGRVVSINKNSQFAKRAIDFASWICSKPSSTSISIESPNVSMFRATHLGQPARWTGDQLNPTAADEYSQVIKEITDANIVFLFPRMPGQSRYLAAVNEAVLKFARNDGTAEEVLNEAATNWESITEELGRESQKKYLRRSEGFSN